MTNEQSEKLLQTIEDDLKMQGLSKEDIDITLEASAYFMLWLVLTNAPLHDENFLRGLEVSVTTLKVLKGNHD